MKNKNCYDRAYGAIMGAFIGDALGVGPHWYYNLDELKQDYGHWIDDYTAPKPGRYHDGLNPGQLSQSGFILKLTLQSLIDQNGYNESDFCNRIDNELFPLLDGTSFSGPGGYTNQSICEAWDLRNNKKQDWTNLSGQVDTTEAAERTLAIAVRYANNPKQLAKAVRMNTELFQTDQIVVAMTVTYCAILGLLIQGHLLNEHISNKLMNLVRTAQLPFHTITIKSNRSSKEKFFTSPDALLSPSTIAQAASNKLIDPAWKVSLVYGMPCAVYHQFPAVYYLSSRYKNDFESAVLHAINGGGQNMARAMLTGALTGAQTTINGIPEHLIDGLDERDELLSLAEAIASQVTI